MLSGERGVATVEFALIMPIFLTVIMVGIQFSMIVVQYYSISHVTRATARWAGINPDNHDGTITNYARTTASTNLPLVGTDGISSVTVSPACTQADFTAAGNVCSQRPSGEPITVTITPNVSRAIFLPTNFRLPGLQVSIPTTLPAYRVTVLIE